VSCYSWPGVRPEPCMHVYGSQLAPLLELLVSTGGLESVRPDGSYFEQALARGSLRHWQERSGPRAPVVVAGAGSGE
jgi:alanine dehydrogenase